MQTMKRMICLALAALLILGCFTGCGKAPEDSPEVSAPAATGGYVEEEIPLPVTGYRQDMVMLTTGALRVAVVDENGVFQISTSTPDRGGWAETKALPGEIADSGNIETLLLSPTGEVFCSTYQEKPEGGYSFQFWVMDADGTVREIPVTYPEIDETSPLLAYNADFTDSGKLMVLFNFNDLREVDLQTGELSENRNESVTFGLEVGCAGEDVYILGRNGEGCVCRDGTSESLTGALKEQLEASMQVTEGTYAKITYWKNAEGYLFFTTHDGLYSYVPDGSVTEELVRGSRSTLGDPSFTPRALAGAEDGSFYVFGTYNYEDVMLLHYTYDPTVPTEPETTLRLYSLYDDENLRQMISQYQKSHPEVAINLEIGLTGGDGVTEADAIRTLNTEILAGTGPDLLRLDGFHLEAYLEKDMLADLSGAMAQAGELLEQVTNCYGSGGKVCAVPTGFYLPAIYGPGHIVSQIHDLDSLVAAATQAKAENPDTRSLFMGFQADMVADVFYDSCSAAWLLPDGSLDEGKLTEYYAAMTALYALDEELRLEMAKMMAESGRSMDRDYTPGDYTGVGGALLISTGDEVMNMGTLQSMDHWSYSRAGEDRLEGYEMAHLNAQASNVFLPIRIMGVLNTSAHQEAACQFITYMLSDEVQSKYLGYSGFPVNQETFDRVIAEDRVDNTSMAMSSSDSDEIIEYTAIWPDARRRQEFKGWVDALTTPALTDRTIRKMVIEQTGDCLRGRITPEEAAKKAIQSLNLYLTE